CIRERDHREGAKRTIRLNQPHKFTRARAPPRRDCVLLPFAPWKISFSGACLTTTLAVGARRTPGSRLFGGGVRRYADSVLIAASDRNTCEADLELSRVTALKGRGDATPPARRVSSSDLFPFTTPTLPFARSDKVVLVFLPSVNSCWL